MPSPHSTARPSSVRNALSSYAAAMHAYCAFLGHQPRISLAELSASVPNVKITRMVGNAIAVFETSEEIDPRLLSTWGGTMLLAEALPHKTGEGFNGVPKMIGDLTDSLKSKVVFSLRADGVNPDIVRKLYRDGKAMLRKIGKPCRYVGTEKVPAATVLLHDLGIASGKHGVEIVMLKDDDWTWVGKTVAVHNPNAYTKRDMGKPVRDMHIGLLPPKLAQVLLNFGQWLVESRKDAAEKKKRKPVYTVLDPFCGSGVIPMESLLRGWPVLASDSSLKAVNGCEKNLDWIRKEEKILKGDVKSTVWKQDATKAFELKELPDMIVTETTLGFSLEKRPTQKEISSLRSESEKVEAGFIENAAKTLKGIPIACTFPVWMSATGPVFLEKIWKIIDECGYDLVLPPGVSTDVAIHKSLLYRRPDQFVGRQIVLLRPRA